MGVFCNRLSSWLEQISETHTCVNCPVIIIVNCPVIIINCPHDNINCSLTHQLPNIPLQASTRIGSNGNLLMMSSVDLQFSPCPREHANSFHVKTRGMRRLSTYSAAPSLCDKASLTII